MAEGMWYYARGGRQFGPVPAEEVSGKLASGELTPQDLLWREGMSNWQPAASVPEFALQPPPLSAAQGQGGYDVGGGSGGGFVSRSGGGLAAPAGEEYGNPQFAAAPGYGAPAGFAPAYGAPPPGQPLNYGGYYRTPAYNTTDEPPPPNHLVGAILATIFCCQPLGIVSIVYAAQVNSKHAAGDITGAILASDKANSWMWWSVGSGLVITSLYMFVVMVGHLS
jgi:hypothetical protein